MGLRVKGLWGSSREENYIDGIEPVYYVGALHPGPYLLCLLSIFQDPPCTLNWGYMLPNSRSLGPNRG